MALPGPRDVKFNLKMSKIEPLHSEWLFEADTGMQDIKFR